MNSKNNLTLSIIIPIYNVELYLDKCLDSLFQQGIDENDFEVVLVNDGSTDHSLEIANSWVAKHCNISIYNQDNKGQAAARNLGIDKSQGRYVMFVDSDDFLIDNTVGSLLDKTVQKDLDVSIFRMVCMINTGELKLNNNFIDTFSSKVITGEDVLLNEKNIGSVCAKFYRRQFLKENELYFNLGIMHEDVDFSYHSLVFARKVMYFDENVYVYRWNATSTDRFLSLEKKEWSIKSNISISINLRYYSTCAITITQKRFLLRKANSIIIGELFNMFKLRKEIGLDFIIKTIEYAEKNEVYPIKKHINSWKSCLIMPIMNRKKLFLYLCKVL